MAAEEFLDLANGDPELKAEILKVKREYWTRITAIVRDAGYVFSLRQLRVAQRKVEALRTSPLYVDAR